MLLGIAACVIALVGMGVSDSVPAAASGYVLVQSVGLGFFWIPMMSLITERGERSGLDPTGVAVLLNLTITIAYTLGPPLATGISQTAGASAAYLGMSALALLALPMVLLAVPGGHD